MQGSFTEKRDRQNRAKSNAAGRKRRNVQAGPQPRRSRRRRDHAVSRRGEAIGDGLDPGDGAGLEQDASDGGDLTGGQHEELGPEADEEDEEEDEEDDDHDEDEQASVDLDWEDIVQALEQHQRRTEPARAREAAATANVPAAEPSPQPAHRPDIPHAAEHEASDPPPVPPAEAVARAPTVGKRKEVREEVLVVPNWGQIRYNPKSKTFTAHCNTHECRRQRSACEAARFSFSNPGQGRPLGLLGAWLLEQGDHDDRRSHVFKSTVHLSREKRKAGRLMLQQLPGSQAFFAHERAKQDGEESEPDMIT